MSKENSKNLDKETQPVQEPEKNEKQDIELNIQDLQNLKDIIDVASSRGAFKPKEMLAVGHVYTKLENFLEAVANQAQKGE